MNPVALKERDVAKQVHDFLCFRGWRPFRMQVAGFTNPQGKYIPVGEKGMPDWMYVYYLQPPHSLTLWVEVKGPSDRRKCDGRCQFRGKRKKCTVCSQRDWTAEEEARGALVVQTAALEEFQAWYGEELGWIHGPDGPQRRGSQTWLPFPRGP